MPPSGSPSPGTLLDRPDARAAPSSHTWVRRHLSVLAPAVLALALSVWRYDTKPLWRDEIYTLVTSGRSLEEMYSLLIDRDAGLAVYYTLMHAWLLVSTDPVWMRLPSVVATVVAVGLTAAVGRRVGGNPVALLAGTFVALSLALVIHAQEARPYPLVIAAVAGTALLALRTAEMPRRGNLVGLALVGALAVGLHPLVALPAVAGIFAALWLRPGRALRRHVTVAGLPAAALGLALVAVGMRQAQESPPAVMPLWKLSTFWKIIGDTPGPGIVVGLLAVTGAVLLGRRWRELLMLTAWAVLPLAAVATLGLSGSYFNARYSSAAVPALCVLAASGLVLGAQRWARRAPRQRAAAVPVAVGAGVLAAVLALGPMVASFRTADYDFDDARSAAAALAAEDQPGDAVVFVGSVTRPLVSTYLPPGELASGELDDVLLAPGRYLEGSRGGTLVPADEREALLADRPRVWLVGTMAVATGDLGRGSISAKTVMSGRDLVSRTDHGHVRVELWSVGGVR